MRRSPRPMARGRDSGRVAGLIDWLCILGSAVGGKNGCTRRSVEVSLCCRWAFRTDRARSCVPCYRPSPQLSACGWQCWRRDGRRCGNVRCSGRRSSGDTVALMTSLYRESEYFILRSEGGTSNVHGFLLFGGGFQIQQIRWSCFACPMIASFKMML